MKLSRFYFFDIPVSNLITQSPLWLLWFQKFQVLFISFMTVMLFISVGLLWNEELINTDLHIDFVVLAQPLLIIYYSRYLNNFKLSKLALYFIPLVFLFTSLVLPQVYTLMGILNKGFDNGFRLSGLSTEPSYFAEFVLLICYLWFLKKRKFPFVYFLVMLILTRSTTLIQSILAFAVINLIVRMLKIRVRSSTLAFTLGLEIFLIFSLFNSKIALFVSKLMFNFGNSWRQASNVIAVKQSTYAPNPNFREDLYNVATESDFTWMKEAVFSFMPWIMTKYGCLLSIVFFALFVKVLKGQLKGIVVKIEGLEVTMLLYSIFHFAVLSPKYNALILLLLPLSLKQRTYV